MGIMNFTLRKGSIMNESVVETPAATLIRTLEYNFPNKVRELMNRVDSTLGLDINSPNGEIISTLDTLTDDIIQFVSSMRTLLSSLMSTKEFDLDQAIRENYKILFLNRDDIRREGLDKYQVSESNHPIFLSYYGNAVDDFLINFNVDGKIHDIIITPADIAKIDKYSRISEYITLFPALNSVVSLIYDDAEYAKLNERREYVETLRTPENIGPKLCAENRGDDKMGRLFDATVCGLSAAKRALYDMQVKLVDGVEFTKEDNDMYLKIIFTIYNQFCLSSMVFKTYINDIINRKHYYDVTMTQLERIKTFIQSKQNTNNNQ